MLCNNCKEKEATVYYKEIIDDDVQEVYLCEDCAKAQGLISEKFQLLPAGVAKMIGSLFDLELPPAIHKELECKECELPYGEFRATGKLGCPACYESFKSKLVNLLRKIHGSTQHFGKVAISAPTKVKLQRELHQLKTQLQLAIKREEFEEAAKLRDRIKELEKSLKAQ